MKRFLLNTIIASKKYYLITIVFQILSCAVSLAIPQIIKYQVNNVNNIRSIDFILLILFALVASICRFYNRKNLLSAARDIEFNLRNKIIKNLLSTPIDYYSIYSKGELMSIVSSDINIIRLVIGANIAVLVDMVFFAIIAVIIVLYTTNWIFALVIFLPFLFMLIFCLYVDKTIQKKLLVFKKQRVT